MMDTGWSYDDPSNTSAPSWMGAGAYAKWWQGSDPDYDPNDPTPEQRWWRSPQVGGGIVWHPYWGWQDRSTVKSMYKSDEDVTWSDFTGWGFTQQLDQDWKKYFPDAGTDDGSDTGDYWSGTLDLGDGAGGTAGVGGTSGTSGGATVATDTNTLGSFSNYPSQWTGTENVLNYLGTNTPWQYDEAGSIASGLASGVDPWYQAAQQRGRYDTQDAIKQAAEQAGLGGTRWSSVMGRSAQDIAGRNASSLAAEYAQQVQNARLQSAGLLEGLGTDVNNQLFQTAGGLQSLGSARAQYPIDLATSSYNMGQTNQETTQGALDKYYKEFLRTAAENNPYLALIYQMATGQGTAQTYNAGTGANLMGILSAIFAN